MRLSASPLHCTALCIIYLVIFHLFLNCENKYQTNLENMRMRCVSVVGKNQGPESSSDNCEMDLTPSERHVRRRLIKGDIPSLPLTNVEPRSSELIAVTATLLTKIGSVHYGLFIYLFLHFVSHTRQQI